MTNKEFLQWIHDRMINVHNENENCDYMHKLRKLIDDCSVPDVPELVRYNMMTNIHGWDHEESVDGDYVLYSQTAEIIAAKDKEIKSLKQREIMIVSHATMGGTDGQGLSINDISVRVTALRNELYNNGIERAEAAEAKHTQYEKQMMH